MTSLTVYISVAPDDGEFALQLADALTEAGAIVLPREQARASDVRPTSDEAPTGDVAQPSGPLQEARALVAVLSFAVADVSVVSDEVERYAALMSADPTRALVPVLLEEIPAEIIPPA